MLLAGCAPSRPPRPPASAPTSAFSDAQYVPYVRATYAAPAGWVLQPMDNTRCDEQVWVSPSGRTSFGIAHFAMPFPVAHDLLLWYFLSEMKSSQGEATLVEKHFDDALPGLRYVARGGKYTIRSNLIVRGFDGWFIYAGTLTSQPIAEDELKLAEQAREQTRVGEPPK
jgi:hypothetical protein